MIRFVTRRQARCGFREMRGARMRLRNGLGVVTLVLCCEVAAGTPAPSEDPLQAAQVAAKAEAETPEGRSFAETVGVAFGKEHGTTVARCAGETKRPDLSDFELLIRVKASGSVDQALVTPGTNLGECVRERLKGWKVGEPPRDAFWVSVQVNLKPKS